MLYDLNFWSKRRHIQRVSLIKYTIVLTSNISIFKSVFQSPEQRQRINNLRHFCAAKRRELWQPNTKRFVGNPFLEKEQKTHIFVGNTVKLLYCAVPKVASTNWKRMLLLFDGVKSDINEMSVKSKVHTLTALKPIYEVKEKDMPKLFQTSYKFMFVRHPFERLASAYRNKLADNNTYFERTYGSRILKMLRKNLTSRQYNRGRGVTFQEFVQWLVRTEAYDPHWVPVHRLCHPCNIRYDFIGKMETLFADADHVIRDVGSPHKFPKTWTDGYKVSSNSLMVKYFSTLNTREVKDIYEYYKDDFNAFDYGLPKLLSNATRAEGKYFLRTFKKILNENLHYTVNPR